MERLEQHKTDNKLVLAYMELIITAFFWGLATVLMKKHIDEIPTFHLIASRFLVGALVVFLLAPKKIFTIDKKDLKVGTILGTLNFVTYAFIVLGLNYTSASKTGFLASLSVLFVPIVQSIINKSKPSKWTIISIFLSLLGLYLISGINGTSLNKGDILIILCALCSTAYILLLSKLGKDIDDYRLSFLQMFTIFILSFIMVLCFEDLNLQVIKNNSSVLLLVGILGTGLTTFLQTKAQKVASPESVGIIFLGEPLTTLFLAYIILNETILLKGLVGSGFITIALIIAILKKI